MDIPTISLKSGFEIPVLALGTFRMGGTREREENYDASDDVAAVRRAVDAGITRFDTAEKYAGGYSEEILGEALSSYDRGGLFVTSKVAADNLSYDDVLRSTENILKRLQTEYVDMLLIHKPNPDIPIADTMRAFDRLVEEGKVRHVGVSNFSVESFKVAQAAATAKIVLNQVHYNLLFREPVIEGLLAYCQEQDVLLEAWRPLEEGSLANPGVSLVDDMAGKYGKTPAQVAMRWLLEQKNVVTLFKTSSAEHLEENLGCLGWTMDAEDVESLSEEYPIQLSRSNIVKLG